MKLKDEFFRLLSFIVILLIVSSILTSLRIKDSQYLLTESGVRERDIASLRKVKSTKEVFSESIHSFIFLDFGKTLTGESVNSHILERLEPTFALSFFAILFGSFFGVLFFLLVIYFNNYYFEAFFLFFSRLILSTPIFLFAISLFIIFFLELGLLPPGGYERGDLSYLILPGLSLGIRTLARIFIFGTEESKTEINSPLIRILKTRGYSQKIIVFKYILYKVLPLIIILIILDLSSLLSGAMIVEEIFFFPGIGKSTFTAIKNMDENLLRALLLYSGIIFYCMTRFARFLQFKLTNIYE
jgi:peptide/nickel transport system permease protein